MFKLFPSVTSYCNVNSVKQLCLTSIKNEILMKTSLNCFKPQILTRNLHSSTTNYKNDSTVDPKDVETFQKHSSSWWKTDGTSEFAALHSMNHVRVPWIRDSLVPESGRVAKPLAGLRILDVGCGGGILSEPLARLGAIVTGLDASEAAIEVASSRENDLNITYICAPIEDFKKSAEKKFDAVITSEIIEHVNLPEQFLSSCTSVLKPHGSLFLTTMNRTKASYALAIIAAENFLHLAPPGTHDWNKFPTPEECTSMLSSCHMNVRSIQGLTINPVNMKWSWIDSVQVNYALHAVKSL